MSNLDSARSSLLSWREIKSDYPAIADFFRKEFDAINGFIPYEQGYVYLIHAVGTNYYKIGKSINPDRRILQIAPKMPFDVRFVRVWRSNFMSLAEKMLHRDYREYRVNGEWFEFSSQDLELVLSECVSFLAKHAYFDLLSDRLRNKACRVEMHYEKFGHIYAHPPGISWLEGIFFEIAEESDSFLVIDGGVA